MLTSVCYIHMYICLHMLLCVSAVISRSYFYFVSYFVAHFHLNCNQEVVIFTPSRDFTQSIEVPHNCTHLYLFKLSGGIILLVCLKKGPAMFTKKMLLIDVCQDHFQNYHFTYTSGNEWGLRVVASFGNKHGTSTRIGQATLIVDLPLCMSAWGLKTCVFWALSYTLSSGDHCVDMSEKV